MLHHMAAILNQKWPPKYKNPPIWTKFGFQVDYDVANWYPSFGSHIMILKIISYLVISCYVLTLFFIHTTSTCIVRLGDICNALRYSNQYFLLRWWWWWGPFCISWFSVLLMEGNQSTHVLVNCEDINNNFEIPPKKYPLLTYVN